MPGKGEPRSSKADERTVVPDAGPSPGEHLPPELLEQVVSETSSRLSVAADVDPEVRAALANVSRRYAGQPLVLDPVAVALVEALLATSFPILAARQSLMSQAARIVAQTLMSDPVGRRRLENMWLSLGEEEA